MLEGVDSSSVKQVDSLFFFVLCFVFVFVFVFFFDSLDLVPVEVFDRLVDTTTGLLACSGSVRCRSRALDDDFLRSDERIGACLGGSDDRRIGEGRPGGGRTDMCAAAACGGVLTG